LALAGLLSSSSLIQAQGLGEVSTCTDVPQITAAATTAALQNDTGLTARQASAVVTTVVRQASQSAPYAVASICESAMQAIQHQVLTASSEGKTPPTASQMTHNEIALLSAEQAATTADGYRKMTKAVVQGAIDGCVSSGLGAEGLQQLITSVANSLVKDAAVQAAMTAIATKNGTADPAHGLPMDTLEEGTAVTRALVGTIVQVALDNGFTDKEVSTAVNRAAASAVSTAQNINTLISDRVASLVANQTAQTVANETAKTIAAETAKTVAAAIAAEIQTRNDTKTLTTAANDAADNTQTPTQNQNQNVNTPTTTPGDQSRVTIPRIIPTPTPASAGGIQ
jgi:hypothetical protein